MAYPGLGAFYAADARRATSTETDVGLYWRGLRGSSYRAAWVHETGELYLCSHGDPRSGGGRVEVLGRFGGEEEMRSCLTGWEAAGYDVRWLRRRAGGQLELVS